MKNPFSMAWRCLLVLRDDKEKFILLLRVKSPLSFPLLTLHLNEVCEAVSVSKLFLPFELHLSHPYGLLLRINFLQNFGSLKETPTPPPNVFSSSKKSFFLLQSKPQSKTQEEEKENHFVHLTRHLSCDLIVINFRFLMYIAINTPRLLIYVIFLQNKKNFPPSMRKWKKILWNCNFSLIKLPPGHMARRKLECKASSLMVTLCKRREEENWQIKH